MPAMRNPDSNDYEEKRTEKKKIWKYCRRK